MQSSAKDQNTIEAYLRGKLSRQEKEEFEARIARDPDLAEEVRHLAGQQELFRAGRRLEMMRRLESMEAAIVARKKRNQKLLAIAATLILMIIAGRFLYTPTPSGNELFQTYYEPYILGGPQRDNTEPTDFDTAWENYRTGMHREALAYFDTVSSTHPEFQAIQLYRAISNLERGQSLLAIERFQVIIDTEGHPYREEAMYYQGLAHLRLEHKDKAIKIFQEFQNQNGQYHKADVEKILKTIHEDGG